MRAAILGLSLIWVGCLCSAAWGQEAYHPYDTRPERPYWVRGLLDVRIAQGGRAPSWTERGPGKMRYGGKRVGNRFERETLGTVSQLALEFGGALPWELVSHVQINWEPEVNSDRPLLIEAQVRKEWGTWEQGGGLQAGVMTVPFSLEHTGPAWTPEYTLSASALNTWLWEMGRFVGVEAEWWRETQLGFQLSWMVGTGFGPDRLGRLLTQRGWVLGDYLSGINSDLPLPTPGLEVSVFDELDHRPLVYTWLTLRDPYEWGELSMSYFDNLGDQSTDGVWETRFGTLGAILSPSSHLDLIVDYLVGKTQTRACPCDTNFNAFYALASAHYQGHRFSARYDVFRIHDKDGPPDFRERGDAFTLAYLFSFGLHHRLAFEYVWVHSHRVPTRSDPSDSGWQLSYRFRY